MFNEAVLKNLLNTKTHKKAPAQPQLFTHQSTNQQQRT